MRGIPTPFIGGAGSPEAVRRTHGRLAGPFAPGHSATPREQAAPPAAASEAATAELAAAETTDFTSAAAALDLQLDAEAAEAWTEPTIDEGAPEAEAASEFFPDFLGGSDAVGKDELQLELGEPTWPGESPERLAEQAQQMLQGPLGPWIRSLTSDLGVYAAEIAIPRAFAAGYLAARTEDSGEE